MKPLVMSNADDGDMIFHNDLGSWNVSRAIRDCRAGKHVIYHEAVEAAYPASAAVEFEEDKVKALLLLKPDEYEPLIAVVENGAMWLIDGRHRLEALHRRGDKYFLWFVIEESDAGPYRVLYNGERKPPFKPY